MRVSFIAAMAAVVVVSVGTGTAQADQIYPEFNLGMVASSPRQVQYRCPGQPVVWLDLRRNKMFYHMPGHYKENMGWGWYVCLRDIPSLNVHFRDTGAPLARPAPHE
jgi:hypothetical protein